MLAMNKKNQGFISQAVALKVPFIVVVSIFWGIFSIASPLDKNLQNQLTASPLKQCLSVRGNGHRAPMTFASIARITEELGMVDAIQGSSSGSIVVYLYESMLMNPAMNNCHGKPCTEQQQAERLVFQIKSLIGFGRSYFDNPQIQKIIGDNPEHGLSKPGPRGILNALLRPNMRRLINWQAIFPNFYMLFQPVKKIKRIKQTAKSLQFDADEDKSVLLREGFGNFTQLVYLVTQVADFYAANGPDGFRQELIQDWTRLFDQCAGPSKGDLWTQIGAQLMDDKKTTCDDFYQSMVDRYKNMYKRNTQRGEWVRELKPMAKGSGAGPYKRVYKKFKEPKIKFKSRKDDLIGENGNSFVTSSVVQLPGIRRQLEELKKQYERGREVETPNTWINGFGIGWWGQPDLLVRVDQTIAQKSPKERNIKEKTFRNLGAARWFDVVYASASEPGMTPARPFQDEQDMITTGGWVDNQSALIMKDMGCEKTIYLNSVGAKLGFAKNAYKELGATEEQVAELYAPLTPGSGFYASIQASDVIWCTDWNDPAITLYDMVMGGYHAPVWVRPGQVGVFTNYTPLEGTQDRLKRVGCYDPSIEGPYEPLDGDI